MSYTELFAPVAERRQALQTKKGFLCRCERCEQEVREAKKGLESNLVKWGSGSHPGQGGEAQVLQWRRGVEEAMGLYNAGQVEMCLTKLRALHSQARLACYPRYVVNSTRDANYHHQRVRS